MSDNIPSDVQMEIVKMVSSVKSVIQFRSVSKQWKSFIDSSDFINGYGARDTDPPSRILSCIPEFHTEAAKHMYLSDPFPNNGLSCWSKVMDHHTRASIVMDPKYIHLVDDDMETFKVQQPPLVVSHLMKRCHIRSYFGGVIGTSYGLSCLFACNFDIRDYMLVIWNPSIGKSFGIALPRFMALDCSRNISIGHGFGVCPVTIDPTVVEFVCAKDMPWHVRVFTLSSGVWNVIPSDKLPRQTIRFYKNSQVVIDKYIYWDAWEGTYGIDRMVMSFDLFTHEFKVVNLPDGLKKLSEKYAVSLSLSELRGSLVVCECKFMAGEAGVWVMGKDSSFRKLFTIRAPRIRQILGFKKNGETIFISRSQYLWEKPNLVFNVYDPCSQQIKNLGISGEYDAFFMGSYKESLLLLDHLDSHIYYDNSDQNDDDDSGPIL